jgi:hypothetical protein
LVHGHGDRYGNGEFKGEGKLHDEAEGDGELLEGELDKERDVHEG